MFKKSLFFVFSCAALVGLNLPAIAKERTPVPFMAEMTSPEIQNLLRQGYDRALIPTAGIEQNGSYGALNKHQKILEYTTPKIAGALGKTLIAPVVNFVPEGDVRKQEGHTAFPGTISVPEPVFEALLLNIVYSLAPHGFRKFYFLGDSGGNQTGQENAARILRKQGFHVYAVPEYYAGAAQAEYLTEKYGFTPEQIGGHMGIIDTSELWNASPASVRREQIGKSSAGVSGDASKANAKLGAELSRIKIINTVKAIRKIESATKR